MSSSPTQVARGTTRISNDEVRAVLHTHIRKTAKFIKFLDLSVHLFAWVAAMFGLWLLACIVDHWLTPLSSLGRWLFWTSAVAGTAWWLITKFIPLLINRINPAYAAKRIEHLLPEFKNGLISWLELDQLPENGVPRGIMSALTYRAARHLGGQDPSTTVDTSRLIKLIGVVLLLFTSLVVYTMVSPKSVLDTGKRIAMPWRTIAAPSRVQILSVKPGAVELTQGKPLDVDVEIRGIRTHEAVRVRFTTIDGQLRDQRVELTPVTEGYHYSGKVRTETTGVEHELDYWIEAGDATSGPYRVSLSPLPSVALEHVALKFPAYTKIADRQVNGGDFEAIEGTRATIHALANQKISRGRWEINPEIDAAGDLSRADAVHELSVDDRQLTGTLLLQLNSEKENPTKLTYRLRGFNARGDGNREPILHTMKVIADVAPEIKLVGPESRRVRVRPTSRLNLEVQANDPDFGLSQIDIEIRRSGIVLRRETMLKSEGEIGQQIKKLPLNMADFKVPEGGTLEIRATAQDNRHDPVSERLAPNAKDSELLTLEVVGADQEIDNPQEQMDASEEPAASNGQSEKNQNAGDEASRSHSNDRNTNDRKSDSTDTARNDADAAEQQPRQQPNPNAAEPNGNRDQGEQPDKQGKQEGKQPSQPGNQQDNQAGEPKPAVGDQKSKTEQSKSGPQSGRQSGTQAGKQEQKDQAGQPGGQSESQTGSSPSSEGGSQSDSSSDEGNKSTQPGSGKSGNDSDNSIGQKSSSPGPNPSQGGSAAKSGSEGGENSDSGKPTGHSDTSKPSDGEVVKRVQEFLQDKDLQSKPDPSNASQKGDGSGERTQGESTQERGANGENTKTESTSPEGAKGEGAKTEGAKTEGAKGESAEKNQNDSAGNQGKKSDASNSLGNAKQKPAQSDTNSNPSDPNGKQSQDAKPENKGSQENGSDGKGSNGKSSDGKGPGGEQSSEGKSVSKNGSQGQPSGQPGSEAQRNSQDAKGSKGTQGSQAEQGSTGEQNAKGEQGSKGESGSGSPSGTPSGSGEGGGKANGSKTGKSGTSGSGIGNGDGGGDGKADQADLDFANRTTQMVLDYLNRQKDQPDPELLRELNWSADDLRNFTERWNKARDLAVSPKPEDQKKWKEMLEDLGLNRQLVRPSAAGSVDDNFQQMRDSGNRVRPPENLRKQYEAFRRAFEKSGK